MINLNSRSTPHHQVAIWHTKSECGKGAEPQQIGGVGDGGGTLIDRWRKTVGWSNTTDQPEFREKKLERTNRNAAKKLGGQEAEQMPLDEKEEEEEDGKDKGGGRCPGKGTCVGLCEKVNAWLKRKKLSYWFQCL